MKRHKHECSECLECFDPEILSILRCVRALDDIVEDVFSCMSCKPSQRRLKEILTCVVLNDVRAVGNLLNNRNFGLSEIKNEVMLIENTVLTINNSLSAIPNNLGSQLNFIANEVNIVNNTVNSPAFGLRKINNEISFIEDEVLLVNNTVSSPVFGLKKINNQISFIENEVLLINNTVNNPVFGLRKINNQILFIENEIQRVDNSVNNPVFGLNEIMNEIRFVEDVVVGDFANVTTGPVFMENEANVLIVQVMNNTSKDQTVRVRVLRTDKFPVREIFDKDLGVPAFSANEFRYIDLINDCQCNNKGGEFEIIIGNMAAGLYPTAAQVGPCDKIISSSIFKSGDFVPFMGNLVMS